jgi:hypothetical protein
MFGAGEKLGQCTLALETFFLTLGIAIKDDYTPWSKQKTRTCLLPFFQYLHLILHNPSDDEQKF